MFNSGVSLADIAAVTGNRDGDGFAGGNGWWVLIILFALFGGWGNNGRGMNNGADVGAEIQRGFDTSTIISKLDGINNGICSLGYDQLAQMNAINQNIMQTGFGIQGAIQSQAIAQMQQANALQAQLAECCCENRAAIAQVRYDMATNTCAITQAVQQGVAQIHEELMQGQLAAKDAKIAEQASLINALNLAQSQANQNQYLLNQLRPCPVPAFLTCNPYGYMQGGCSGCNGVNG